MVVVVLEVVVDVAVVIEVVVVGVVEMPSNVCDKSVFCKTKEKSLLFWLLIFKSK